MNKPIISIIAAIGENGELGKDNKLLWNIPEDLKRFKKLTSGHPIIMGRKTFESIGRLLPNRTNIIITRDPNYKVEGALVKHSLEDAVKQASDLNTPLPPLKLRGGEGELQNELFIIGGGQIFAQALPIVDKLYLTIVHKTFDADTFFPDYSSFNKVISKQEGSLNDLHYTFVDLVK